MTFQASLSDRVVRKFQRGKPVKFPLNEEATSLSMAPSGQFVCAGFTDGTVRMFDLTGYFRNTTVPPKGRGSSSGRNGTGSSSRSTSGHSSPLRASAVVDSKRHQRYGAVACQIHAKGVHTSLRMHVELSEDGLWCFAGVLRGSMELIAIHLGELGLAYQQQQQQAMTQQVTGGNTTPTAESDDEAYPNLLDHITVYRHSDAKLRGFGACTRLQNSARYLLFTGKAIKNIHIWAFDPPTQPDQDPVLVQLYDTSTNGNTIHFLQFRRHSTTGALQAISKSNDQRLRVWDLTEEERGTYDHRPDLRPNRPPFQDVPNTEGTLAVAGGLCVCGGSHMYNQMSLVSLNVDNLLSPYNHTEMALPGIAPSPTGGLSCPSSSSSSLSSSRRTQRGDLKSVVAAYGSVSDGHDPLGTSDHILLEVSDGTLAQYQTGQPQLTLNQSLPWYPNTARTMTVGRLPGGCPVAVVAMYQAGGIGKGQLSVWPLEKFLVADHPLQSNVPSLCQISASPLTDEKSVASTAALTAATTPESNVSRQSGRECLSAKNETTTTRLSDTTETTNPARRISIQKESSVRVKLVLRLPEQSHKATASKVESGSQSSRPCPPPDAGNVPSKKQTPAPLSQPPVVSNKKAKRRFSCSDAAISSHKSARRFSNDRPHNALTLLKNNQGLANAKEMACPSAESFASTSANDSSLKPISPPDTSETLAKVILECKIPPKLKKSDALPSEPNPSDHEASMGLGKLQSSSPPSECPGEQHALPQKETHNASLTSKQATPAASVANFCANLDKPAEKPSLVSVPRQRKSLSSCRPTSPSTRQLIPEKLAGTVAKVANRRTLITPTPNTKDDASRLSVNSAALALSSIKRWPPSSATVETPLLIRRTEAISSEKTPESRSSDTTALERPISADKKTPLPAPRVLHLANNEATPAQHPNEDATSGRVTPLAGNKRKDAERNSSGGSAVKSKNEIRQVSAKSPKHVKIDPMGWLRPEISLRGRRDDVNMRRAITSACAQQRVAIENKMNSLASYRVSGALGAMEKLQAEHRAASIFWEKRVWRSVRSILQSLERAPSLAALHESKTILQQLVHDFRCTAIEMARRHEIEISAVPQVQPISSCATSSSTFDLSILDAIVECFPRVG